MGEFVLIIKRNRLECAVLGVLLGLDGEKNEKELAGSLFHSLPKLL
jgi:hypothetical protein